MYNYSRNEWRRCENYTRNEWGRCIITLETSGEDQNITGSFGPHSMNYSFDPLQQFHMNVNVSKGTSFPLETSVICYLLHSFRVYFRYKKYPGEFCLHFAAIGLG